MARLDNAGMHRSDRNLVQAFAFGRKKCVAARAYARDRLFPERMHARPRSRDRATAACRAIQPHQDRKIVDRAFEPNGRWMTRADARIFSGLASIADDSDHRRHASFEQCHVDRRLIAPEAEQRAAAGCELIDRLPPAISIDDQRGATAGAALALSHVR